MPCAASWKPRWREFTARARPADFRRIEAHLARERQALESGDAQARNRLLGDFHLLLAEIVGNQVLTDMLRAAGAQRRHHRAVPEHARRRLFLARAPCLHPGRAQGRRRPASALMDEHLRHVLDALDFQAGAQGDADLVTALLR